MSTKTDKNGDLSLPQNAAPHLSSPFGTMNLIVAFGSPRAWQEVPGPFTLQCGREARHCRGRDITLQIDSDLFKE